MDTEALKVTPANARKYDIDVTRLIDAPVEKVWKAWTDCDLVMRWWGPANFTSHSCEIDFRVGGKFVWHMRGPKEMNFADFYVSGTYTEIVPLELIAFIQGLSDKNGNRIDPGSIGMPPDFPREHLSTMVFKRVGSKTELTATEYGWTVGHMANMSEMGLGQTLDKLCVLMKT